MNLGFIFFFLLSPVLFFKWLFLCHVVVSFGKVYGVGHLLKEDENFHVCKKFKETCWTFRGKKGKKIKGNLLNVFVEILFQGLFGFGTVLFLEFFQRLGNFN